MVHQTKEIRVRFAPSPTGFLHIGGLRTALMNWLFARNQRGKFLVRIEDTDRERFLPEYESAIINSLAWAGIAPDEPYVHQYARQDEHRKIVQQLLDEGKAYYCFCTMQELEAKREAAQADKETFIYDKTCRNKQFLVEDLQKPHVIRFKVQTDEEFIIFEDLIRGQVSLPTEHIDDFVIVRTDGGMMFNLVVVLDDIFMRISHVIRGEDHIVNTGKHILLFRALGAKVPAFAHMPLILGPTGQKLSKRDAAVGVQEYQEKGFLPEALCNYLVRLGWSHGDQEIFTREELVEYFKVTDVNTHGAIFDAQKLLWMNSVYIKALTAEQLLEAIKNNINTDLFAVTSAWNIEQLYQALDLYKDRSHTLVELVEHVLQLYTGPKQYDQTSVEQWITNDIRQSLKDLVKNLENTQFTKDTLQECIKNFVKVSNLKFPQIAQPIRIALLGFAAGPGIYEMMEILGKQTTLERLQTLL
ncbi:MAG: glutamate--tRNA ligase [Candidatus Chromulinivorax sp.]